MTSKTIADCLTEVGLEAPSCTAWSEEQWAANDAKVERERERESRRDESDRDLIAFDWPERAVRIARQVSESTRAAQCATAHNFAEQCVLVLSGAPGVGKTVAAAIWALRYRWSVRFVRASTFAAASRYDAASRERWFDARALVLDDLGAEYLDAKGSFLVDLDELVDTYYGRERPLVITTNLDLEAFTRRYGARVLDRLRESGRWASVAGESMRKRA